MPSESKNETDVKRFSMENVVNFIDTLEKLEFPTCAIFSCADLESTGWEERSAFPLSSANMWSAAAGFASATDYSATA